MKINLDTITTEMLKALAETVGISPEQYVIDAIRHDFTKALDLITELEKQFADNAEAERLLKPADAKAKAN